MSDPSPSSHRYVLNIPRHRFVRFLLLVVAVLLTNHVMLQVFHFQWDAGHWLFRDLFDVDEEENFPTYYSSCALLIAAGLLYVITCRKYKDTDRFARHWGGLSIIFLVLSVDEVAGVHESLNTVTDFPWTIPAAVAVVILGVLYSRFLFRLPAITRNGFLIAGTLFVAGAVGVEHVTDWYLLDHSMDSLGYNLFTAVEEGLEMLGVVLFINSLLRYMETDSTAIGIMVDA